MSYSKKKVHNKIRVFKERRDIMKTGLVMEGGAMRGMFTAGILDVFMENGLEFDGAIGASAGAVFGCNYKSRQIGRTIRYNKKYCKDKFAYHLLPEKLDPFDNDAFMNNPMEFYVVCTDAETGKAVYHKCESGSGEDLEWMRASASMPLVSEIVEIGDIYLSDGGVADSIPIEYFKSIGYNKNVIILTQPLGYEKKKNKLLLFARIVLRKYPKLIEAMEKRHKVYNKTTKLIEEMERSGEALVIRPKEKLKIGHIEHNPDVLERVYQIGRKKSPLTILWHM